MTREEAIDIVRKNYPHVGVSGSQFETALQNLIPELRESKDEMIRKALIKEFEEKVQKSFEWKDGIPNNAVLAWLEKQKENPQSADSIPSNCTSDAKCEDRWHKVTDSLPDNGREVLAKDKLGNTLLARYDGEGWDVSVYDDEDYRCHNGISKWCEIPSEKQKDHFRDLTKMIELQDYSDLTDLERAIHRGFLSAGVENVPVTIIKETANECKRTQTIANENANAEWSEEDKKDVAHIIRILDDCYAYGRHDLSKTDHENLVNKLKSLPERFVPQPKQEWSEEDADILNCCISSIEEAKKNRYAYKETDGDTSYDEEIDWLKSLRPVSKESLQPQQNMSISFMLYLDEHRPDGKMCLSNAECNEIETAFKNQSWDTILRYVEKYQPHWKPSEEQMEALKDAFRKDGGNEYRKVINSLYCDLEKLL